ncbi:MAG: hypothetical protein IIB57_08250, partial [Planctomycetes bacterium]|nr:hypothetical protein [Planctomycetota bacterium]
MDAEPPRPALTLLRWNTHRPQALASLDEPGFRAMLVCTTISVIDRLRLWEGEFSVQRRVTSLTIISPFSLKATALSHGWHECAPMSWSEGGSCFQVIERHENEACRVSVTEAGRPRGKVKLRVMVESSRADKACVAEMVRRVRVMLGLDADLREFHARCERHPTLP